MTSASHVKLRHLVPSVVTAFAICAGMCSIRMSLEGHVDLAL
jgi:CDP-diacylglycerol--serine O-phosphatidyltransferase